MKQDNQICKSVVQLFDKLKDYYGDITHDGISWWPGDTPLEIMIGAILTQNTNWLNVEKALVNLKDYMSIVRLDSLPLDQLSILIRPSGFHNQKSKRVKALILWLKSYNGDFEKIKDQDGLSLREELLSINGIGPETADSILLYGLRKPSFVIDAYTRRILERVGVDLPPKYDGLKSMIEGCVTRDLDIYDHYHGYIVEHAKRFCNKKPKCNGCPLGDICKFAGYRMK